MEEGEKSVGSWWQTIPGVLTAIAGIITAVTGLIVVLHQIGAVGGGGTRPSNCDISGSWQHSTEDVGQAEWIFTPIGGNRYDARERGLGNATGKAVLDGNRLRIDWKTDTYSGYYEWDLRPNCTSGTGKLVFSSGGRGTHKSRIYRGA
jgi:hypothetical protein